MKTIEERARQFALETTPYVSCLSQWQDTYKRIASEQQKIDIDKALSFLRIYGEGDFSCREEFEAKFRKAMEG